MKATFRPTVLAALCTLALGALGASSAQAAPLNLGSSSCGTTVTSNPFARWLDVANYALVPGGSFEPGGPAWTRTAGAAVVPGNETFYVHGKGDAYALRLPAGSSATSPAVCTGLTQPTLRYFARNGGSLLSGMTVQVLYPGLLGQVKVAQLGVVSAPGTWQPSLPTPVLASLLATLPGSQTSLAFRFSVPRGGSTWSVDDVYVDPFHRS